MIPSAVDLGRFDPTALTRRARQRGAARLGRQGRHQGDPDPGPHAAAQGPPRGRAGGAPAQGDGAQGLPVRVRRRGPGPQPLLAASCGTSCSRPIPPTWSAWRRPRTTCRPPTAAATAVVSAAIQPEGLQRTILEALAMARPVVVSDLAAGPDIVLAPPAVPEERMTGLRFAGRRRRRAGGRPDPPAVDAGRGPPGDRPARPRMGGEPLRPPATVAQRSCSPFTRLCLPHEARPCRHRRLRGLPACVQPSPIRHISER